MLPPAVLAEVDARHDFIEQVSPESALSRPLLPLLAHTHDALTRTHPHRSSKKSSRRASGARTKRRHRRARGRARPTPTRGRGARPRRRPPWPLPLALRGTRHRHRRASGTGGGAASRCRGLGRYVFLSCLCCVVSGSFHPGPFVSLRVLSFWAVRLGWSCSPLPSLPRLFPVPCCVYDLRLEPWKLDVGRQSCT